MDEIVDFCSGLMEMIKDLAGGGDDAGPERPEEDVDEAHRMHLKTLMDLCQNQRENI